MDFDKELSDGCKIRFRTYDDEEKHEEFDAFAYIYLRNDRDYIVVNLTEDEYSELAKLMQEENNDSRT